MTFIELDRDDAQPRFDIHDLLLALRRRWGLLAITGVVVGSLAAAFILTRPPQYVATTTIMISPAVERVVSQEQSLTQSTPDSNFVDSEVQVIQSPELMERLVRRLRLDRDARWVGAEEAAARANMPADAPVSVALVQRVGASIAARRRGTSYVIDVSATTGHPNESARLANALVEIYRQADFESRSESATRAHQWLDARLETLRQDVQAKEAAASTFRAQSGLLTSNGVPLTESQIGSVQTEVLRARADLAAAEARQQQLQAMVGSGSGGETLDSVLQSPTIRDLRQREGELLRRQAGLENNFTEVHPDVLAGRAEIANVRQQLAAEIARIQAGMRNDVQVARMRLQTLEGSLYSARGALVGNNQALIQLNELDREAEAARSVYESFLQRQHEVSGQAEIDSGGMRMIASARPPETRSSPKLGVAILFALACGALAGLAAAFIAEFFDDALRTGDSVMRKTGGKLLASMPLLRRREMAVLESQSRHPAAFIVAKPTSAFAEAHRVLRTTIMHTFNRSIRAVAVTSAAPNEGKTTTSLCLARVAALSGQRTILVECDLRRNRVKDLLSIEPDRGLRNVLEEGVSWRDVVLHDADSTADILPSGPAGFTSLDLFDTEAMRELMQSLRQNYDLIVLDCPPVLAVAEARVIAALADGAIIIARAGKSQARAVKAAIAQTEAVGGALVGVVLNGVDPRAAGRVSYADPLHYHYGRSYYETAQT
jgi:capsular exopolysaccharide synthesis family protein